MTLRRLLLGALVLLALLVALQYWALAAWRAAHEASLRPLSDPPQAAALVITPQADTALALPPAAPGPGDWSVLVERPKFVPGRRPPDVAADPEPEPEPEPEPPEPAAEPLRAMLRSVVIGPETAQVWLQPEGEAVLIKLSPGDRHQGWRLEAVEPQGATFVSEDATQMLPLRPSTSPALTIDRVDPATPPPPLRQRPARRSPTQHQMDR